MKNTFVLFVLSVCLAGNSALAEQSESCSSFDKDIPFESTVATASMLDNVRNKKGSLRYETNAILAHAENKKQTLKAPENFCPEQCKLGEKAHFVFSSVPRKFLQNYSDSSKCAALFERTKKEPFVYADRTFNSLDDFSAWYNDFSQGKGNDGKDLYRRCDGSCSPQYESWLKREGDKYVVTSKVICGPARDKKDNTYQLTSSFRWVCEDAS